MTRVMITGATGFVGRHAIEPLLAAGHELHAVTRSPPSDAEHRWAGEAETGGPARGSLAWHRADLLESPAVVEHVRPEVLVHLAWYAEHGTFWTSPENVRWVEASLGLLRALVAAGGRRAVIAGTCAEYEWARDIYSEDAPQRPATLYGAAKHALCVAGSAYATAAGLQLAWGRIFYVYGRDDAGDRFVPAIARSLLTGKRAPMTPGEQVRDFLAVSDLGRALAALVDSELTGPINLASGVGRTLRSVAIMIAEAVGSPELLDIGALSPRPEEPPSLVADVRRLRDELGFRPSVDFEVGIADTVQWLRSVASR